MVISNRNAVQAALGTAIALCLLFACKPLSDLKLPPPPPTCSGAEATSSVKIRQVFTRFSQTKCLDDVVGVRANSNSEAEQCLDDALGNPGFFDYVTGASPSKRCVVAIDAPYCTPRIVLSISASDAVTCVASEVASSNLSDKTSDVMSGGNFIDSLCINWCENHGYD